MCFLLCCYVWRSISRVQRGDAGEYCCQLILDNATVESPSVVLEVEGEMQLRNHFRRWSVPSVVFDFPRQPFI